MVLLTCPAFGQPAGTPTPTPDPIASALPTAATSAQPADHSAPLVYANRSIVQFRAIVLSRPPSERAAAAVGLLNRLVDEMPDARVTTRSYDGISGVFVGGRPVFFIFPADVDELGGEELGAKTAAAAASLQLAFDESVELHTPRRLIRAGVAALLATLLFGVALWALITLHRKVSARLSRTAERQLRRLPGGEIVMRAADAPAYVRRLFALLSLIVGGVTTYAWLAFVLRRFPYTRPWGESLRAGLISVAASAGRGFVDALPSLAAILGILIVTRLLARLAGLVFQAVENGRITIPGLYPETAQPTRRIVAALLWVFALVASYEYLPGSDSDAFKAVSVFVGLVISLGSTGIVNHLMSGLMITYSRAFRPQDFVKIGDIEGVVTHLGTLSTKIKTARNEEITIPNAIVVSHATTNYSRHAGTDGVFVPTSVTIGYDTPWRQVHALLLRAAERTTGVRTEPKPIVLQSALQDFYVQYTLLVCLEEPRRRNAILAALHAQIQDAFNEFGVQIMSPNYEADPSGPKVVPPDRWYASPAAPVQADAHPPAAHTQR
jgi:small-conductance mechanosensitive channel